MVLNLAACRPPFWGTFFLTFHAGYLARWHDPGRPRDVFGEADRESG